MAGQIPNFIPGDKAHLYEDLLKAQIKNINYVPGKPKVELKPVVVEAKVEVKPKGRKPKE